mmetsp:Transcript_55324/g.103783  ORF Transcript_55324/g.103783 Transcript_55324/m.103783 type:complete len:96 (-) Transcript_55324:138-425(-)
MHYGLQDSVRRFTSPHLMPELQLRRNSVGSVTSSGGRLQNFGRMCKACNEPCRTAKDDSLQPQVSSGPALAASMISELQERDFMNVNFAPLRGTR